MPIKICTKCARDEFETRFRDKHQICRACENDRSKEYQEANKEYIAEYKKEYNERRQALENELKELVDYTPSQFSAQDYKHQLVRAYLALYGPKVAPAKVFQVICDKHFPEGINRKEVKTYLAQCQVNWAKLKKTP